VNNYYEKALASTENSLTVLAEPGTWLVRKARRDFQPEISAIMFNRKLCRETASGPVARHYEIRL